MNNKIINDRLMTFWMSGLLLALGGCNVYSSLDSPKTEAQYLDRARACYDQGDVNCAKENYLKVSGTDQDYALTELVFSILEDQGLTVTELTKMFSNGGGIDALVNLVGTLAKGKPGVAMRAKFVEVYKYGTMISQTQLKGMIKLIGSFSLAAAILAEDGSTNGFTAADFVAQPTTCKTQTAGLCLLLTAPCSKPSGKKIVAGAALNLDTVIANGGRDFEEDTPTLGMLHGAIMAVTKALPDDLAGKGGLGSNVSVYANDTVAQLTNLAGGGCYRQALLAAGVFK